MEFDPEQAHGWVVDELRRKRPVAAAMADLVARCAAVRPHPDWAKLAALPYSDLASMEAWIRRPFQEEPPGRKLKGLWFGLNNPCPDGRRATADVYVAGAERFEADPDDNEWAVDAEWMPQSGQAGSKLLAEIYRIAYRTDDVARDGNDALENDAEYPLVLGYGAFVVRELLARIEPEAVLGTSRSVGVAVGFDSGDFVLIGELTPAGLKAFER